MTAKELKDLIAGCPDDAPIGKSLHIVGDADTIGLDFLIRDIALDDRGRPVIRVDVVEADDDDDDWNDEEDEEMD